VLYIKDVIVSVDQRTPAGRPTLMNVCRTDRSLGQAIYDFFEITLAFIILPFRLGWYCLFTLFLTNAVLEEKRSVRLWAIVWRFIIIPIALGLILHYKRYWLLLDLYLAAQAIILFGSIAMMIAMAIMALGEEYQRPRTKKAWLESE
jgi:hypothetical protein